MNFWDVARYGKKLILLNERTERNAKDIEELRQDLKDLTETVNRLASVIQRNQVEAEAREQILSQQIKIESLEIQNELLRSNQLPPQNKMGKLPPSNMSDQEE